MCTESQDSERADNEATARSSSGNGSEDLLLNGIGIDEARRRRNTPRDSSISAVEFKSVYTSAYKRNVTADINDSLVEFVIRRLQSTVLKHPVERVYADRLAAGISKAVREIVSHVTRSVSEYDGGCIRADAAFVVENAFYEAVCRLMKEEIDVYRVQRRLNDNE